MKEYLDMFLTFARIGGLTFGGGYAMLPMLQKEVVENKKWATNEEIMDYYAIGQCLPGLIAVNTAAFIGQKMRGTKGGYACAMGVVFPSFVIIAVIAAFISGFADLAVVRNAFAGIRVCVCVLIYNAVLKLWKKAIIDWKALVIFAAVFLASTFTDLSPILFVILAGAAGILIQTLGVKKS
ncbi:MAG: chromate transporter [Clostridia bacterium]|nr:chromate transporter [Clostridia bacterium]